MPLYEYLCSQCDATVEILIRNENEKATCPECGSKRLQKQLSVAAAPAVSTSSLPVSPSAEGGTCGRPQCQSGCMFD